MSSLNLSPITCTYIISIMLLKRLQYKYTGGNNPEALEILSLSIV